MCVLQTQCIHQVHSHVVAGTERGIQRIRAGGGQIRHPVGIQALAPQHHGIALGIDAAPTRTTGQLRVLPRCEICVLLAVELGQLFQNDRAGGHVDTQRQGFGGEAHLEQPPREQILHDVPERGQHAGVVGRKTAGQRPAPLAESENVEVFLGQVGHALIDRAEDLFAIGLGGEIHPVEQELLDRTIAADAGEDEVDRRQHSRGGHVLHHVGALPVSSALAAAATTLRLIAPMCC